jgi:hypothetical protein
MSRLKVWCAAACLAFAAGSSGIHASGGNQRTLVVTMTNDPTANEITAQVGVISDEQRLVTLKADTDPGTVDVIALDHGRIAGSAATAVSAPDGTRMRVCSASSITGRVSRTFRCSSTTSSVSSLRQEPSSSSASPTRMVLRFSRRVQTSVIEQRR